MNSADAFNLCLGPHGFTDFVAQFWEREPAVVSRNDSFRFSQVINLAAFDELVAYSNLRAPYFRIFKNGAEIPTNACTTIRQVGGDVERDLADLNVIYDEYDDGATIVLVALEKQCRVLSQLCVSLGELFGCPIQAYAYLTPANSAGPPAHYDTHDIFVLQVEGSKRWRVWRPVKQLPLRMNENVYEHDAVVEYACQNTPMIETVLTSGDSLYIPRGFVHVAETTEEPSLHVSLSAMVIRFLDVIESAVQRIMMDLENDEEAQRSISFGRDPNQGLSKTDVSNISALVKRVIANLASEVSASNLDDEYKEYKQRLRKGSIAARLVE